MTAPIAAEARQLIASFEGYHKALSDGRCAPYLCPARVATLGFGTTYYEGGRKVKMTDPPITRERATQLLDLQLATNYAPPVDRAVKVSLHPLSRGACVSLAYNIGTGAFAKSTALRMINQQRWSEVPRAFGLYRMGGGRVLAGLERRRKAEALMFMAGVKAMQAGAVEAPKPVDNVIPMQPKTASVWGRFLQILTGKAA